MALNTYRNNPLYPDRYTRNKRWSKILPVRGRPLQSAELIEVQSILQDNLKQGFDTLFKSGTAIKGLRVSVSSRSVNTVTVSISPGQLYINGSILDTVQTTLTIPSTNVYNIFVEVTESIITEVDDSSLRDPIRGAFNLGSPGASRLIWETSVNFSQEDDIRPNTFAIAQVANGVILQRELNPFFEVQKILARFVFERSGNFCVEGLSTSYIGLSRRSVSNTQKYEELQNNLTNAQNQQQSTLSNAVAAQELVNQLTQQELAAIATFRQTQNPADQAAIANISNQLSNAKNNFANLSANLVSEQSALQSAQSALEGAENLVTDQQVVSVSPGVGYVEGYRVAINSPTQLFIPQSLPSTNIDAATYTYRGISAESVREFSVTTDSGNVEQGVNLYTTIELAINNIELNPSFTPNFDTNSVNITIEIRRDTNPDLNSMLSDLVTDCNTPSPVTEDKTITYRLFDNQVLNNPELTTFNNGNPIDKTEIKILLRNYISLFLIQNTISFSATDAVLNGQDLFINIDSNIYETIDIEDGDNPGTLASTISTIQVNIPNAPLNQPISTSTYQLGFRPVNKIERLTATLTAINVAITRGAQNESIDTLPDDTVLDILSITQPNSNQVFLKNIGYRLTPDGTGIKWNVPNLPTVPVPGQSYAPASGTTYFVTFTYTEPLVENTDFRLNPSTDSIEFIGRTPRPGSTFTVDYSYFLSKAGLITLDRNGRLGYILSAASRNPIVPAVPSNLLALSSFTINVNNVEINRLECRRQTVEDLYDLSERVRQNTLNNEAIKLDIQTLNRGIAANRNPIGVFSDSLVDVSKLNLQDTTAFIVPSVQGFINSYAYTEIPVNYVSTGSTAVVVNNQLNVGNYIIMPYTHVTFLSQPRATKTRNVTQIPATINKRGRLYLSKQVIFLNTGVSNLAPCDPITRAGNAFRAQEAADEFVENVVNNIRATIAPIAQQVAQSFETGNPVTIANTRNQTDFVAKAFSDVSAFQSIIELYAEGLPPTTPGFKLYIDGAEHSQYTLINGTSSSIGFGTNSNNLFDGVTSKSDGTISMLVTLPSKLPTGTHTFTLERPGFGYCKGNFYVYNNLLTHMTLSPVKAWDAIPLTTSASKLIPVQKEDVFSENLTSLGIDPSLAAESVDPTITIANTVAKAYPSKAFTVNQTFVSPDDYYLTQIKLKIANQPTGNNDELYVFLTNTSSDLPRKQIHEVATASTYTTTTISQGVPGVQTTFEFNTPQLINRNNKYNIGLETYASSPIPSNYEVYTAIADDPDLATNSIIGEQLYLDGDLFSSTDGSSFVLEDKEDLTFELTRAEFNTSSEAIVNLGNYVTIGNISYFCLNTRDVVPVGTEIIYEYRPTNSTGAYTRFKPNIVNCLSAELAGIEIRARLLTNFNNLSPMLLLNGSSVSLYRTQDFSSVISKQVTFDDYYTKVYVTLEYIQPGSTEFEVFYSPTRGFSWEGIEWFKLNPIPETTEILNEELQLYRTTFFRDAGADTASPTDTIGQYYVFKDERKFFRYKIDLNSNNTAQTPLVRKIATEVSQ